VGQAEMSSRAHVVARGARSSHVRAVQETAIQLNFAPMTYGTLRGTVAAPTEARSRHQHGIEW
jgi:hypothetical protein